MQRFREAYNLESNVSPDKAMQYLQELVRLQPGFLLNLDICPVSGEGILAVDAGAYDPAVALQACGFLEKNWEVHVCAYYYLAQCLSPSLQSLREGVFLMTDATNMTWKNIGNLHHEYRLHHELLSGIPVSMKAMMEYNSNSSAVLFWGLVKKVFPKEWLAVLEVGCQVECHNITKPTQTLADLYLQPTPKEATCFLLRRARELLCLRAVNEAAFRL